MQSFLTHFEEYLLFFVTFIALTAIVCGLVWSHSRQSRKIKQAAKLINDLYSISQQQAEHLAELESSIEYQNQNSVFDKFRQSTLQQMHSVVQNMQKLQQRVDRVEDQEPTLKMYNKASQMAAQGASEQDIIEASGLPLAEVEILMGMQKNPSQQRKTA